MSESNSEATWVVEHDRGRGDWTMSLHRGGPWPTEHDANAAMRLAVDRYPCLTYRVRNTAAPSVLAEATLAAAVKVDPPRDTLPALNVPHLRVLFDQWQKRQGVTLPVDSAERKLIPLQAGCYDYFSAALCAIAAWSAFNNDKHNPGQPLHWSQHKSGDHPECLARHTVDMRETSDPFTRLVEATARAWRANAELQMICQELGAPLAPGARAPEVVR